MKKTIAFLESIYGPYPFRIDKYGVAQTPYAGMEHQTIIAYGGAFQLNDFGFDFLLFMKRPMNGGAIWSRTATGKTSAS